MNVDHHHLFWEIWEILPCDELRVRLIGFIRRHRMNQEIINKSCATKKDGRGLCTNWDRYSFSVSIRIFGEI